MTAREEWRYVRAALVAVVALLALAVVGWRIEDAAHETGNAFERLTTCLRYEKRLTLERAEDPIARSAGLGAWRTAIETNAVTVAVGDAREDAERVAAAYRSVLGDVGTRLEVRGTAVYLWDGPPEPTQRQALYDCTVVPHEYASPP